MDSSYTLIAFCSSCTPYSLQYFLHFMKHPRVTSNMVVLRKPRLSDLLEIKKLYEQSVALHTPWTTAPQNYEAYLMQENRYFLCSAKNENIIGTQAEKTV